MRVCDYFLPTCFAFCGLLLFVQARSFTVGKNCFVKDGEPFRYISGTIHYWRQLPEYWEDTFVKMRAAGLNAVSTYLNWNLHEPVPGQYNFDGVLDVRRYFQLAQKHGLLVILRPGPYIDAEVDLGGLPYWLLRINATMALRTSDPTYLYYVERWYRKVLPMFRDLTYASGGPIITAQIENEYGSFPACDKIYQATLKKLILELLGPDIVLYTTDGPLDYMLTCGQVNGSLTTCDFGAGDSAAKNFAVLRKYNVDGPLVNSEFYPGWIDHWAYPWATVPYQDVLKTAEEMLLMNASFNIYPIRGGTNFGFVAGANLGPDFQVITTSYDFDAPLDETGDPTEKYYKIRELIGKYVPLPPGPAPQPSPKGRYGPVKMEFVGTLFDNLDLLVPPGPVASTYPLSFEVLEHGYGFVLYRTVIKSHFKDPAVLSVPGLADRAIVMVDQKRVGILSRSVSIYSMPLYITPGQTLDLLVHNEGRNCYGPVMNDLKGILHNVTLDSQVLANWEMYPLDLPHYPTVAAKPFDFPVRQSPGDSVSRSPAFFRGSFLVDEALDTFLNLDGWTNGYVFVNGHNLGRYWPVQGPQQTIYVPYPYLLSGSPNTLELFELEEDPCRIELSCSVEFVDSAVLNGPIPQLTASSSKNVKPWTKKKLYGF